MKKKIMTMLVALSAAGYLSAVDVNENLSIGGFIDGSYSHSDGSGAGDSQSLGLDEVEIDFLFNAGGVSGEVHVDDTGGEGVNIEQAFLTYSMENGLSITFGRYASALGLEGEDPAGLFGYSRAYGTDAFNLGNVDAAGNTQTGISLGYGSDTAGLSVSLYDGADLEDADLDIEIALTYAGIENVSIGAGMQIDNGAAGADEVDVLNVTATYAMGKTLFGAEYTQLDSSANGETDGYLIVVDHDFSDVLGLAVRYSDNEGAADYNKFSIAPNYAITDSLGAILEFSDVENGANDSEEIALELTFTF